MIAIRLDKQINPNTLLQIIDQKISQHRKSNNMDDSILCIEIKTISQISDELIPKLENKLEKLDDRGNEVPESAQNDN